MAIAFVNSGADFTGTSTGALNFTTGWTPTAGNTLFVWAWRNSNASFTCADGEGTGNSYVNDVDITQGTTIRGILFRCSNISGSGAYTITISSGTAAPTAVVVAEYSGLDNSSPVDVTPVTRGSTTTNPNTALNITTTNANDLLICGYGDLSSGNAAFTAGSGYGLRQSQGNGGSFFVGAYEDQIVSSTGTYANGFTYSPFQTYVEIQAAYKASSGAVVDTINTTFLYRVAIG